ncbi:hypothetical protein PGTUg99_016789 [Puccinia graminis f. sp. tritici]|uniref:Uncharacterized protein n=1 Tax=Puccinia graminis f. sp. tritici TaxID=56615 RepID=A0A5B0RXT2_PUCGR|nr:hypothetical protein PGTUg99_016789 [Puccinia graminis f. sp. tritici]
MTPPTWPMSSGLQGQDFHGPRTQGFMAQGGVAQDPQAHQAQEIVQVSFFGQKLAP